MSSTIAPPSNHPSRFAGSPSESRALNLALFIFCALIVFANLGGPALFEPDEGRNAEKAREILILGDWITPHENFLPVLDKPITFYWLVACAYQLFGVSEWSARLPSAIAALGCLFLVYRFARLHDGVWVARWSMLILLTSVEFFLLARIVIGEMSLTFFVTLALLSFYSAAYTANERTRLFSCLLMYIALALGTLVKGLPGLVVPGMVVFFYLLFTRKWRVLGKLRLVAGVAIYLLLAAPWYLLAAADNPGYLRYFFWEEHFGRYWTNEFNRSQGWYYFFGVLTVGFLPWIALVPATVRRLGKSMNDSDRFLALWAVVPFIFFSTAGSKLPHYLLPIFPPLAILTARTAAAMFSPAGGGRRGLFIVWAICATMFLYLALGAMWPDLVVGRIRDAVVQSGFSIGVGTALVLFAYAFFAWYCLRRGGADQTRAFVCTGLTLGALLLVAAQLQELFSLSRSAKPLARSIAPLARETRLVLYNTYPTGLIFYLDRRDPLLIISPRRSESPVMDNPYLHHVKAWPTSRFGKVLLTTEEFGALETKIEWPIQVLVKERHLSRFLKETRVTIKPLIKTGEHLLVARE